MRNILKATTVENKLPLLAVENGCIVSKDADITVCYEVTLPELYTVTSAEYEAIHGCWCKAIKVLPDYSILHKQDWFVRERYEPELHKDGMSFLSRSFERHFNERPFLNHSCYLYLTKTTKERNRMQSNFSTLCRGHIIPREVNRETAARYLEAVDQFEHIMNDSGFVRLRRLSDAEIVGTKEKAGIIERYLSLQPDGDKSLQDIDLDPAEMRVGDNRLCLFTLSDVADLPAKVGTDVRYERLSTDRSDCRLSFASPVGLLLSCNHIYNQYVILDNSDDNLQRFEKSSRNMQSLSRYSRSNAINSEWIEEYLNEAHSGGLISVRAHYNVIAWSDDGEELKRAKNDIGSQLASMECMPRHNTVDCPTLYWAGIPGNQADFPAEESFYTFIEQATCLFIEETNYRSSLSPFGIKMVDRLTGKPLHLDISDLPMKTHGQDGIYYTYSDDKPISFNPFYVDDMVFSVEKKDSIKTLLLTLWKSDSEKVTKTESGELGSALNAYIELIQTNRDIVPCFDTFYEYVRDVYRQQMAERDIKVERDDFNIDNFLTTLRQYYKGGRYDFLLNSKENIDLLSKRFVVFDVDTVKDNKELFPIVTIIIMEAFINKMRRLKGIRKVLIVEEAWKALASENMAEYMLYLYKTVRKYFGEAIVVTQEVDDIISSPIVKESIINNSDCKILLDQRKYMNKFDQIQTLLGLTDKEKAQILSINQANDPSRLYKEVWIGLGGTQSAVYATEVSPEEYLAYTTEETEKMEVQALAEDLGGDMELAIKRLADERRNRQ